MLHARGFGPSLHMSRSMAELICSMGGNPKHHHLGARLFLRHPMGPLGSRMACRTACQHGLMTKCICADRFEPHHSTCQTMCSQRRSNIVAFASRSAFDAADSRQITTRTPMFAQLRCSRLCWNLPEPVPKSAQNACTAVPL